MTQTAGTDAFSICLGNLIRCYLRANFDFIFICKAAIHATGPQKYALTLLRMQVLVYSSNAQQLDKLLVHRTELV